MGAMPGDPPTPAESTTDPSNNPPTALPSVTARVLGFLAIIASGAVGAFIGYAFTDLQCHGACATPDALGGLVGAIIGAFGVAVVVVLALRAMGEWKTIQHRPTGPDRPALPPTKRPRVR
jgi:hypothetical protein